MGQSVNPAISDGWLELGCLPSTSIIARLHKQTPAPKNNMALFVGLYTIELGFDSFERKVVPGLPSINRAKDMIIDANGPRCPGIKG